MLLHPVLHAVVFQSLSHIWLCDPMECSAPGFPVLHHLPEFAQSQVYWVGDAIQPSLLCHTILLLPLIFTNTRVFSNVLHSLLKYFSLQ